MIKTEATIRISMVLLLCVSAPCAAQTLSPGNFEQLVPAGKEVDAIYGDFAIGNQSAKAVIAAPSSKRHANMTVRAIGGCLIDFAANPFESDQLSAFYPGRKKFPFAQSASDGDAVIMISPATDDRPECKVRYEFRSDKPIIDITTTWLNTTKADWQVRLEDEIRADSGREDMLKSPNGQHDWVYINDVYWQQAYGLLAKGFTIQSNSNARDSVLVYKSKTDKPTVLKPGESFRFYRQMIVARDLVAVAAIADQLLGKPDCYECKFLLIDADSRPIPNARISITADGQLRGTLRTDQNGTASGHLPAQTWQATSSVAGSQLVKGEFTVSDNVDANRFQISSNSYRAGVVKARITDGNGQPIPAKIEFEGSDDTPTPNWGPETADHFVRNLAYTENGQFEIPIQAGVYNVIVSHGPEFDALFTRINVSPGKTTSLNATLKHSVKTNGWVSSDFHSHSSPSGDNTSSQRGRVLNLAAENIEFAPCTEHNRVSSYSEHIAELGLENFLATVSGIELTGSPLPLNHQNVFPMVHRPRTQDGGGPLTAVDPDVQIERLTLWDNRIEKLIQQNHPDIGWLFYDKDGNGEPDAGYRRAIRLTDVMEIHPIDRILTPRPFEVRDGKPTANQRIFNWLQLLNQGIRIYGVVNTDAHYNYHGSGWLRNWIQSSTDDPAKIDSDEMVRASEQGRLIMSNGPYLEATFRNPENGQSVVCGQDLVCKSGQVKVEVKVQCPNWLDINTVFLIINGRIAEELRFTREKHPKMFANGVVKFEQTLELDLKADSHIIVVTGNQLGQLGPVMGSAGNQRPAALTNPVFVDIDGNGFTPNQDTLGHPLPVKFGMAK